jgi:hypothetical protein
MPERVTREERMVSLAIEKARKAKQELSAKKRMNIEPTQVNEFDSEVEVQKIKRPKVQDASKITNQTQDKEGYGLAGETLKKAQKLRDSILKDRQDKYEMKQYISKLKSKSGSEVNYKKDESDGVLTFRSSNARVVYSLIDATMRGGLKQYLKADNDTLTSLENKLKGEKTIPDYDKIKLDINYKHPSDGWIINLYANDGRLSMKIIGKADSKAFIGIVGHMADLLTRQDDRGRLDLSS